MDGEAEHVLQALYEGLSELDSSDVGALCLQDSTLTAMDGVISLTAQVHADPNAHPSLAHCHVLARIGSDEKSHLDACVLGFDPDRVSGLRDAARNWIALVAGPVFSLAHARPVLGAEHFDGTSTSGVVGCHGFLGPLGTRFTGAPLDPEIPIEIGLFEYAQELAPPTMSHLAKVTLNGSEQGWKRMLEIDGHGAAHSDGPWPSTDGGSTQGIVTRFATFHFADQPEAIAEREQVDRAIRRFVSIFQDVVDVEESTQRLEDEGVNSGLAYRVHSFLPISFGRLVLQQLPICFSPHYTRIRSDGTLEEGCHLMREPVFARAMVLSNELLSGELMEACKTIAMTSAEFHAVNNAMNAGSDPKNLVMAPSLIPDRDATPEAMDRAIALLQRQMQQAAKGSTRTSKKPWWRFW